MPNKRTGRVATADRIATLLRIYRSAVRSDDGSLRDASAMELFTKYGIDVVILFDGDTASNRGEVPRG